MVMGGDSCSRGPEFESQHQILHGQFFTVYCEKFPHSIWCMLLVICCKNCIVCLRKTNKKEAGDYHFL